MITKITLGIGLFLFVMVIGGWMVGVMLAFRINQLEIETNRLAARLMIQPRDVLCSISAQVEVLHDIMATHCEVVHGVRIPRVMPPPLCGKIKPELRPQIVKEPEP